jgi:glycosyltransferase involved in cell wall biosynthesis
MPEARVLHLIASRGLYGAEQVLLNLLPALNAIGFSTTLGCISSSNYRVSDFTDTINARNVEVFSIPESGRMNLGTLRRIRQVIRETHADILHTHGYKATILGGLITRMTGTPLMSTCHGEASKRPDLSTYLSIENIFIRKATAVFAVSESIRGELIARRVPQQNITVIHNGIDDPIKMKTGSKNARDNTGRFPHILCVGRLIRSKRFDLAIQAVDALRGQFPSISLSIAGDGPDEDNLRRIVRERSLEGYVKLYGYVQDTISLYEDADIFLLPSETEGSPMVLIEAMAYALPIIVTSVGAVPEMVEDGKSALVLPPGDLDALVKTIEMLASNTERRSEFGAAARQRFLSHFSSDVMAKAYAQSYITVLEDRRRDLVHA